jgi:methionyl-tRNA formyltransferase
VSRPRTIFIGSGRFGLASLSRLADDPKVNLVGVVTAPPRPAGRAGRLTSTPIHETALELGVGRVLTPDRLRAPDAIAAVLALAPELAILADYGQIVPAAILDLPHGALNLHPSVLPRHRGATPIPAAILAGDTETGVTLFRMDAGLDTGPIVDQVRQPLHGTETAPLLEDRLMIAAADLLDRSLTRWVRGEVAARPQGDEGATLTRQLHRRDGRLDPGRPADLLERQVRAYQPWPGSWFETDGSRVVVWRADAHAAKTAGKRNAPGVIVSDGLATANGVLVLREVQPAGGRRMTWQELLRGRPELVASRVSG